MFIAAFVLAVAMTVTALVIGLRNKPTTTLGKAVSGKTQIEGFGAVKIAAHVYLPVGPGPHPLLVVPGSWGASAERYAAMAKLFTDDGYIVIAYAQRGIGASQGQIDLLAEPSQRDVSRIITWALNHEPVDPHNIAALGLSYGAGASLLAAERDPRIKAVVAMSTWTDLTQEYFPNATPNTPAIQTLYDRASVARLSPEVAQFHAAFAAGNYAAAASDLDLLSPSRSPITNVAALNRNNTAVMIVNDYQDSYFDPAPLTSFFDKLTTPKRLMLGAGDHGTLETPGLNGQPSPLWDNARKWLDHYVRGVTNGIDKQPAVQLLDMTTNIVHSAATLPSSRNKTLYLGGGDSGTLATAPLPGWTKTIHAGLPTTANAAPLEVGIYPYRPVTNVRLATVSPTAGAVWDGAALAAATTIVGQPLLHMTVTPSAAKASVFVHLYDVNTQGLAALVTTSPYSITNATAAVAMPVDITLQTIAYTVPAGHHLAVVIDTVDPKFASFSSIGQTVTFTSSATDPSRLEISTL